MVCGGKLEQSAALLRQDRTVRHVTEIANPKRKCGVSARVVYGTRIPRSRFGLRCLVNLENGAVLVLSLARAREIVRLSCLAGLAIAVWQQRPDRRNHH
jgi:hypothetical protein